MLRKLLLQNQMQIARAPFNDRLAYDYVNIASVYDSVNAVQNTCPLTSKTVLQNPPLQKSYLQHYQMFDSITDCIDIFPFD